MSFALAPINQVLLQDDFTDNAQLNSSLWYYPTGPAEFIPAANGGPGTELAPSLPVVANGALQLTLQTYNPTSSPPGTSFEGSAAITRERFSDNSGGIAFTAVAKLATTVPGMDGGIFSYGLTSPTTANEIDFESLSDHAGSQNSQELTNIYSNAPTNSGGHPSLVPDPSLTSYQTYTIEWFPNEVLWFIDGQLVRESTANVPQGPMQFALDFWAFDPAAALQPTASAADNTTYTFDVQSLSVAAIENNTLGPTPPPPIGTTADMILRDASNGDYEIYDIGNNAILAGYPLGQVGTDYVLAGLGDFYNSDTTDMLLRSRSTGAFEVYDISNNNISKDRQVMAGTVEEKSIGVAAGDSELAGASGCPVGDPEIGIAACV